MPLAGPALTQPNPIDSILATGLSRPDELALITAEEQYTWRQLDECSRGLAAHYLAMGLKPGDRVASLLPNRPGIVIHYLACLHAGLVATPLNYRYMPPEIDHALELSEASILVHHEERTADVAASKLAARLPFGAMHFDSTRLDPRDDRASATVSLQKHLAERDEYTRSQDPDAPAFIYFTSGSTGKPKGVTHTRRTFGTIIASLMQAMKLTSADVSLPASSFSHVGGSTFGLATLAAGARLVIPRSSEGSAVLPLLRTHRPTLLWMLPAPLIALVRDHDAQAADFASIRLCISGGDKVSAELEREFTDLAGFAIDEGYGMTEIGTTTLNPPSGENRLGSIGTLCPGFELSIRDDAGKEVPANTPSRLWIRSPSTMVGYWRNPVATGTTIVDGWLDTGDVMRVDADGYLWFCGRKKQIIIHDGSNICPQEVEEAVAEHPAVESVGVVGIHDAVHGETVRAYVTLKPGVGRPASAEIIAFARERVGYKAPEEIVVLPEMPLNATGKVDRVTLKQLAEEKIDLGGRLCDLRGQTIRD